MDSSMLQLLRFIHIVTAALWVGISFTLGFFVFPALLTGNVTSTRMVREIMVGRKLAPLLPVNMLLVVLSGAYLYWIDFRMPMRIMDPRALDYTLGAFFGIVALITGFTVSAPAGMRLMAVLDSVGAGNPTVEQSAEIARLSRKVMIAARSISILALGAAGLMALARYAR